MIFKNVKLRLVKVEKRQGVQKETNVPYLFYVARYIDDGGDVINLKFGKKVEEDEALMKRLIVAKNVDVVAELGVYPSGFSLKGIVTSIEL